ncbi:transposase DNA-binding-containing protein [Paraburkholderia sp. EG286B]|uniref:transposase DNA-binding-containing protein n=1 Tax=Paraburkholderia sp. EG286B TaxID=3237011 RepID=UPI0034D2D5D4
MNALKLVLHRTPFRPAHFDATIPACGPKVNIRWSGIANTIVHLRSLPFSPNLHRAGPDEELEGIDLVDEHLNERTKRLLMRFAEKPTESIVGASHG